MLPALLEAGPTRLRPIVMTTLTMVFGMLPIAMSGGSGADMRKGMAIVVIGALISSTLSGFDFILSASIFTLEFFWDLGFAFRFLRVSYDEEASA